MSAVNDMLGVCTGVQTYFITSAWETSKCFDSQPLNFPSRAYLSVRWPRICPCELSAKRIFQHVSEWGGNRTYTWTHDKNGLFSPFRNCQRRREGGRQGDRQTARQMSGQTWDSPKTGCRGRGGTSLKLSVQLDKKRTRKRVSGWVREWKSKWISKSINEWDGGWLREWVI